MFEWIYSRIARRTMTEIESLVTSKEFTDLVKMTAMQLIQTTEFQAQLAAYADGIVDRELARVQAKMPQIAASVGAQAAGLPNLTNEDGELNLGSLASAFLGRFLTPKKGGETAISERDPFNP